MDNVKIDYNGMRYLFDKTLSLKAKGLMATMVAYINKYSSKDSFSLEDVKNLSCDGVTAFNNAMSELKAGGYVEQTKIGGFRSGTRDSRSPWMFILKE